MQTTRREYIVELNERGVPIHNNLLLFPQGCVLSIERPIRRNDSGIMLITTNYPDTRFDNKHGIQKLPMEFNLERGKFVFSMDLDHSGPYYVTTSFISRRLDILNEPTEGPTIRLFVENQIHIGLQNIGSSGLCIQSNLSSSLGPLSEWNISFVDTFLAGYNCVHLTPLQTVGTSGSCFSLRDVLDIDHRFLDEMSFSQQIIEEDPFIESLIYTTPQGKQNYAMLHQVIHELRDRYQLTFITDIVLNHISSDCPWLIDHYDISYTNKNTPQLIPAIELDNILVEMTEILSEESFVIDSESKVNEIIERIRDKLRLIRFEEYWLIGSDLLLHDLSSSFLFSSYQGGNDHYEEKNILKQALYDSLYEVRVGHRYPLSVDLSVFLEKTKERVILQSTFDSVVIELNNEIRSTTVNPIITTLLESVRNTIRFRFLQQIPVQSIPIHQYPLIEQYFTNISKTTQMKRFNSYSSLVSIDDDEQNTFVSMYCVNNGWTWNNNRDPLHEKYKLNRQFVFRDSMHNHGYIINTAYLLREIIVWSDCVKLRYYERHQPTWIYNIIQEYIRISVYIFDGIRLDNCHNTSIEVLEEMLQAARQINPSVITLAELFTSNHTTDIEYISRVGIDMIVRETAKESHHYQDTKQYSDLLYSVGGEDFGSLYSIVTIPRYVLNTKLPIVLYDITHDNQSFIDLYGIPSIPSVTVLMTMAVAHVASTRGHDEGYPINPSVIEQRQYQRNNTILASITKEQLHQIRTELFISTPSSSTLILPGNTRLRLLMNQLHQFLSQECFTERYIHHYPYSQLISIERRQADSHYSVLSITNTAFNQHSLNKEDIHVIGRVEGVFVSVQCHSNCYQINKEEEIRNWKSNSSLSGTHFTIDVQCDKLHDYVSIEEIKNGTETIFHFSDRFLPGNSIVVLLYTGSLTKPTQLLSYYECCEIIATTEKRVNLLPSHPENTIASIANQIRRMKQIDYDDFSYLLFTSDAEQQSFTQSGVYQLNHDNQNIKQYLDTLTNTYYQHHNQYGMKVFTYAGLYGLIPIIRNIVKFNLMNHPLLENIRQGNWLVDYILQRISNRSSLQWFYNLLISEIDYIKLCPRNTRPVIFCKLMMQLDDVLVREIGIKLHAKTTNMTINRLSLATLQFTQKLPGDSITTIMAGIPHFTVGIMRNWGRDTFIAAPGILLTTGRYEESKALIIAYASVLRHGLICNLYADGVTPRFNSRDSVWWWLRFVQLYYETVDKKQCHSHTILNERIQMHYPQENNQSIMTLADIIQSIIHSHGQGIDFIEWNAPYIDISFIQFIIAS